MVSISACGGKNETVDNQESNTNKLLSEVTVYESDGETEIYRSEYVYDDNENLERVNYYSPEGAIDNVDEYDLDGNIIKTIFYDESGNETSTMENEYVNGNLVKATRYNMGLLDYVYEYDYNQNNARIRASVTYSEGDAMVTSEGESDANGNIIVERSYDENGNVMAVNEYDYDGNGNVIKITVLSADGTSMGSTENEYDKYGNITKECGYSSDGSLEYTLEYEYEYDTKGNVILETDYYDGNVSSSHEYNAKHEEIKTMNPDENGKMKVTYEAEYDSEGNIIKGISYDLDGSVYDITQYTYK